MTAKKAGELMRIERQCVTRADVCGRDCVWCDLVQDTDLLLEAYDFVISAMAVIDEWEEAIQDDGK